MDLHYLRKQPDPNGQYHLILAEKPSYARNIADTLDHQEGFAIKDGVYYGNSYVVTAAFGHLYELFQVNDYPEFGERKWSEQPLPVFPSEFQYKAKRNTDAKFDKTLKQRLSLIKNLLESPNCLGVIHAGDADREGEVIIRLILEQLENHKPVYRLWVHDQTLQTIYDTFDQGLPNDKVYNLLYKEGLCRMHVDWLYGMNYTRLATLKSGLLYTVGRVQTPILRAIVEREEEIANFVSKPYYTVEWNGEKDGIPFTVVDSDQYDTKPKAEQFADSYNNEKLTVQSIEHKTITERPPKLYDLSGLQSAASDAGLSMERSAAVIQALYEKGYITYPRTNTTYLAESELDNVASALQALTGTKHKDYKADLKNNVFCNEKIESHSAICPTGIKPEKLTDEEIVIYKLILKRFLANFLIEARTVDRVKVTFANSIKTFAITGKTVITNGWGLVEDAPAEKFLPTFEENEAFEVSFVPKSHMTKAPNRYTIKSLNHYMKNPFQTDLKQREQNDADDLAYYKQLFTGVELGTEATRTTILQQLKKREYISLQKNQYRPTEKGIALINIIDTLGCGLNKENTVSLNQALKSIQSQTMTYETVVDHVKQMIQEAISEANNVTISPELNPQEANSVGNCPICGASMCEYKWGWGCANYKTDNKCTFGINRKNPFANSLGHNLTKRDVKSMLAKGETGVLKLTSKKTNKTFSAKIVVDDWSNQKFHLEFAENKKRG